MPIEYPGAVQSTGHTVEFGLLLPPPVPEPEPEPEPPEGGPLTADSIILFADTTALTADMTEV